MASKFQRIKATTTTTITNGLKDHNWSMDRWGSMRPTNQKRRVKFKARAIRVEIRVEHTSPFNGRKEYSWYGMHSFTYHDNPDVITSLAVCGT